jgi:hypothetical protein
MKLTNITIEIQADIDRNGLANNELVNHLNTAVGNAIGTVC